MLNKNFNKMLLEGDAAFKDLQKLLKGDKDLEKIKKSQDTVEYLDAVYNKYEKDIEKIIKKYKLDYDELGSMLTKL